MNKKDILNVMLPQMPSIVQQWDSTGIIIESQFLFASQHIMKHHMGTVYELIVEYGGHKVEDEYEYPLALATEIP